MIRRLLLVPLLGLAIMSCQNAPASESSESRFPKEITGRDGAPMVLVPTGEFWMGSSPDEIALVIHECIKAGVDKDRCQSSFDGEIPRHHVSIETFYLDKYEMTNSRFDAFVRSAGYRTTAEREGKAYTYVRDKWTEVTGAYWRRPEGSVSVFDSDRREHPVVSVSWEDADAYCRWASKRLPTEAEFEYANRAGTQTRYWWGERNPGSRRVGNIADETNKRQFPGRPWPIMEGYTDGYATTAPVASFEANPWGFFDLTGNAAEWTADWYDVKYFEISPARNPPGPPTGVFKVFRGGSWYHDPLLVRSTARGRNVLTYRAANFGFRCAQDAPNL